MLASQSTSVEPSQLPQVRHCCHQARRREAIRAVYRKTVTITRLFSCVAMPFLSLVTPNPGLESGSTMCFPRKAHVSFINRSYQQMLYLHSICLLMYSAPLNVIMIVLSYQPSSLLAVSNCYQSDIWLQDHPILHINMFPCSLSLNSLGALSRGDRRAAMGQGGVSLAQYNMDNKYGRNSLLELYRCIEYGRPGDNKPSFVDVSARRLIQLCSLLSFCFFLSGFLSGFLFGFLSGFLFGFLIVTHSRSGNQ